MPTIKLDQHTYDRLSVFMKGELLNLMNDAKTEAQKRKLILEIVNKPHGITRNDAVRKLLDNN